jgi:hypothetical protein
MSYCGIATVVSGASRKPDNGMSLNPTTETSDGQFSPRPRSAA